MGRDLEDSIAARSRNSPGIGSRDAVFSFNRPGGAPPAGSDRRGKMLAFLLLPSQLGGPTSYSCLCSSNYREYGPDKGRTRRRREESSAEAVGN